MADFSNAKFHAPAAKIAQPVVKAGREMRPLTEEETKVFFEKLAK